MQKQNQNNTPNLCVRIIHLLTCQKKRVLHLKLKKGGSKEKQLVKSDKEDGKTEEPEVHFGLQRKATRQIPDDDPHHKHCKGSVSGSDCSNNDEE